MRAFKNLYMLISYLLLAVQIGFLVILIYNKIFLDRVLYYGNDEDPATISLNYFYLLKFLLYATFSLMITWAILTPLAVISNKGSLAKDHINVVTGLLAFTGAIVLLIIDPMGIFKWFTG
jgi:hypothetical protein